MEIYESLSEERQSEYKHCISAVGSLSRMFNKGEVILIPPKTAEKMFCKYFDAEDIATKNSPADAKLPIEGDRFWGIGIKTFMASGDADTEKVGEFNAINGQFTKDVDHDGRLVAQEWNARLVQAQKTFSISGFNYHCVVRKGHTVYLHEFEMGSFDIDSLTFKKEKNGFSFVCDGVSYSFYYPKSVLHRTFILDHPICSFDVEVLEDPFDEVIRIYD